MEDWFISDCIDYPLLSPSMDYTFAGPPGSVMSSQYEQSQLNQQAATAIGLPLHDPDLYAGTAENNFIQAKLGIRPPMSVGQGYFEPWQVTPGPILDSPSQKHPGAKSIHDANHGRQMPQVKQPPDRKSIVDSQPKRRLSKRPQLNRTSSDSSQDLQSNVVSAGRYQADRGETNESGLMKDHGAETACPPASNPRGRCRVKPGPRLPHNQVERKYREGINSHLQALRRVLPPLQRLPGGCESEREGADNLCALARPSKATILATATAYIKQIEAEKQKLVEENKVLLSSLNRKQITPRRHVSASLSPNV